MRILRIRQRGEIGGDIEGLHEIDHDAGHCAALVLRFLLDDGREPVLRRELLPHRDVGLAHARADDRPVVIGAGIE